MTKLIKLAAFAVVLAVTATATATAADKVDNPIYKSWAQFKPGTSVVQKMTSEANGVKSEITTTTTLVEVKDDKVVVEATTVSKINGMEFKAPPAKQDIPKQYEMPKTGGGDPKAVNPEGKTEDGTKKVKVGGTEFECKWMKYTAKDVESETFTSDGMPGLTVKSVSKAGMVNSTIEVTEVTIKK